MSCLRAWIHKNTRHNLVLKNNARVCNDHFLKSYGRKLRQDKFPIQKLPELMTSMASPKKRKPSMCCSLNKSEQSAPPVSETLTPFYRLFWWLMHWYDDRSLSGHVTKSLEFLIHRILAWSRMDQYFGMQNAGHPHGARAMAEVEWLIMCTGPSSSILHCTCIWILRIPLCSIDYFLLNVPSLWMIHGRLTDRFWISIR